MDITVIRTGGQGGRPRRATLTTSDPEMADLARRAVAEGHGTPPVGGPEGFSYEITVDDAAVYCADPRLTTAQAHLITEVFQQAG
ncbi:MULTISPECIES: protealysin inhibitor emfourin [unclassified Streptomyces]|uniref:protealysin inhibitor emfourin n=1 Tax=unclassified Streptomyces TaxID=2593676 RepID=UPI0022B6C9E0|nr:MULTISPECIES: protealysin inhibitor emfourin [unclassified Streptomyces]MCZ7414156.1 hypothetical protein [Streptomyces sp. WMMC897]MCZ7431174.1 hypothetical protein [Streptomyces sp. WMMC1477]